jgi:hypothetical protein
MREPVVEMGIHQEKRRGARGEEEDVKRERRDAPT